jgi:excinuclease ABC subunit C
MSAPQKSSYFSSDFKDFPTLSGVYLMKNEQGTILYIGKAKNLRARIRSYFIPGRDGRLMVPYLTSQITLIDYLVVPSEKEALILENSLIKQHQPKYNILLKDDKTFMSIMVNTSHEWPSLKVARVKGKLPKKDRYFGPYINAYAARQTLELMRSLFPLRQCSDHELYNRSRPCMLYDIGKCPAPCCQKCLPEDYKKTVERALNFLEGKNKDVLKDLQQQLKLSTEALEFEKASRLFKLIQAIEHVQDRPVLKNVSEDLDILALARQADRIVVVIQQYRDGRLKGSKEWSFCHVVQDDDTLLSTLILQHYEQESSKPKLILLSQTLPDLELLEELINCPLQIPKLGNKKELVSLALMNAQTALKKHQDANMEPVLASIEEIFELKNYPERIECIDQSQLSGTEPVSAIVTYIEGQKEPKSYRTYKLLVSDDYGGLEEVLERRFRDPKFLPDLLLIDGGKGHLSVTQNVLSRLNITGIDVIAITKEQGRHDKGLTNERFFINNQSEPKQLSPHSPELFLLQKIRDEAHRFVLAFQKKRREKKHFKSELDDLPGIGPVKKKRLLQHFGSIKKLKQATVDQLKEVEGLTQQDVITLTNWSMLDF